MFTLQNVSTCVLSGEFVSKVTAHEFNGALAALETLQSEAKKRYSEHVWDSNMTNWYYDVFSNPLQDNEGTRWVVGWLGGTFHLIKHYNL